MTIDVGVAALLSTTQRHLWDDAIKLLSREETQPGRFSDYGFIVFPAAKVYEGFLKTFFYQMGFISRQAYYDEHFRIGKALNPDLPRNFRDETWVVDDLETLCGTQAARRLWEAWKVGRNATFHYQIDGQRELTLNEAKERVAIIERAMRTAMQCEMKIKRGV